MINSKTLGSALLFTATCIGAGMLALPLSTAGPGFIISMALLIVSAATSILSSLFILEILSKSPKNIINFNSMSQYSLGKAGQWFCTITYLTLLYTICCAFVSGATSMITAALDTINISISSRLISFFYILITGIIVFSGHKTVDWLNRGLFSVKGISFIVLIALLFPGINVENLMDYKEGLPYLWAAVPILFFSFGSQVTVPTVYHYLNNDTDKTRRAILIGGLLPFLIYAIWLIATLGSLPRLGSTSFTSFLHTHSHNNIGQFFLYLQKGSPVITTAISVFANIAIATSFISVALALNDFCNDLTNRKSSHTRQPISIALTFAPTLLITLAIPDIFQTMLVFSAAAITFIFIFLPAAMVISIRHKSHQYKEVYTVKGGLVTLTILILMGCLVLATSILTTAHKLPVLH